jgi:hypothetical protein
MIRAIIVGAGTVATGAAACLAGAVIAASPAQAPTLDEACRPTCAVVTPAPLIDRPVSHPGRIGPRKPLKP